MSDSDDPVPIVPQLAAVTDHKAVQEFKEYSGTPPFQWFQGFHRFQQLNLTASFTGSSIVFAPIMRGDV
jgi:hypothetical protein